MISYNKISGNIEVVSGEEACTVILDDYIGSLTVSNFCVYLKFILKGSSKITNDIVLSNHNKLDTILFEGNGTCEVQTIGATSIETRSDITVAHLKGNVIRIEGCELKGSLTNSDEPLIESKGHVWLVDCILSDSSYSTCISSPYVLIDNSEITLNSSNKAIDSPNAISIENCSDALYTGDTFRSKALVVGHDNKPKAFIYVATKNPDGSIKQIASREKLFKNSPAELASPYDLFKDSTQYTNVNLHRRINQDGELVKGKGTNYITDEMIFAICYPVYNGISFDRIDHVTSSTWSNSHKYQKEAILDSKIEKLFSGEDGTSSDFRILEYAINEIMNHTYIYPGDTLKEVSKRVPLYESSDWEVIPDNVINEICKDEYEYDGHPHSLDIIDSESVNQIINGEYNWPKISRFDLDESRSRHYEVGIYSLNSYRTTEYVFYDENTEITEDRELP